MCYKNGSTKKSYALARQANSVNNLCHNPKPKPITLPEHIRNKINLMDEKVDPETNSPSKLVLRPWSREDETEWLKIQQERRQYYTDMGREEMMKKITWGRNITP